jgi:hypothetical protein
MKIKLFLATLCIFVLQLCFAYSNGTSSQFSASRVAANTTIVETYYYTNSTYTVQCGYRYVGCQGQQTGYGCITPYKKIYTEPCFN